MFKILYVGREAVYFAAGEDRDDIRNNREMFMLR